MGTHVASRDSPNGAAHPSLGQRPRNSPHPDHESPERADLTATHSTGLTVTNNNQVRSTVLPPGTPVFTGGLKVLTRMGRPRSAKACT